MKRIKYFILEKLTLYHPVNEKLTLNKQSKITKREDEEKDFYDLIKELENLNTSYGNPEYITSSSGKRKNYSLEEGKCYLYSSTTNKNEILYIYDIMDVSDENTGNIEHVCIIINKYPKDIGDDKGLIGIHAAIIHDNTIIDSILKSITGNINKFQASSYFHIINMEQFLEDFKTFIDLLIQKVPTANDYEKSIKNELGRFNKYLLEYSKWNNHKDLKDLIKFYKV